jgi:hypothetical protein
VLVGVGVGVAVLVKVDVLVQVGVGVDAFTVCIFPANVPPVTIAGWPLSPYAFTDNVFNSLWNCLLVIPATFRSNTSINVCGAPLESVTNPLRFVNVTDPDASNVRPLCTSTSPAWYSPVDVAVVSWYNFTEPATVSFTQSMFVEAFPVNTNSFTATASIAEAINTTCIDDTFVWSKTYVWLAGNPLAAKTNPTVAVLVGVEVVVYVFVTVGVGVDVIVGVAVDVFVEVEVGVYVEVWVKVEVSVEVGVGVDVGVDV